MNHDNAAFEIHVHGDIPIKPGTDAKVLQETLRPLWHYACLLYTSDAADD